jgi:LmbE family N-acetylglucosaminyl deacetylase
MVVAVKRWTRRRWTGAALVILAVAAVAAATLAVNAPVVAAWWYAQRFDLDADRLPATDPFVEGDRVLVVSPHPDDEALCCGGAIQLAHEAGAEVWIVHVTSGDGFELDALVVEATLRPRGAALIALGHTRMREALAAAAILGVAEERVVFLGFPDRGLRDVYRLHEDTPYRSPFTLRSQVVYEAAVEPGTPFTGGHLIRLMREVFEHVQPTVVLAPTPLDGHPDHRTVGEIVLRVLGERGELSVGRWWIVHGDAQWPLPKGVHMRSPLFPPLRARHLPWTRLDLEHRHVEVKLAAIRAHESQVTLLRRYLESFAKRNELFSPLPLAPPR